MKKIIILLSVLCFGYLVNAQTLKQAEYFIDKDKGFGKNTKLNLASSADSSYMFNVDLSGMSTGQHKLYIRTKDSKGKWSQTARRNIYVVSAAKNKIITGEYFFDKDPGYGKADKIGISSKDTVIMQNFTAVASNLKAGFHKLYIRVNDNYDGWSITARKSTEIIKTADPVKITAVEYFFTNDPGYKKATAKTFSTTSPDSTFKFKIAYNKIPSNADTIFIRAEDSLGNWSITKIALFSVQSLLKKAVAEDAKISSNNNVNNLRIFPNPASNILNFSLKGMNSKTEITILNSNGAPVKKYQSPSGETGQIHINDLASGAYILQLSNGTTIQSAKFIKE